LVDFSFSFFLSVVRKKREEEERRKERGRMED
jgi:hypothetical protein